MKRFNFRLEKLLHIREMLEAEQAQILARALGDAEAAGRALEQSRVREATAERDIARLRAGTSPAGVLTALDDSLGRLRREWERRFEAFRLAEERVLQEQETFDEVRKDRETLDNIKQRQYAEWMADVGSREQKDMDEVAARISHRAHRSGW